MTLTILTMASMRVSTWFGAASNIIDRYKSFVGRKKSNIPNVRVVQPEGGGAKEDLAPVGQG